MMKKLFSLCLLIGMAQYGFGQQRAINSLYMFDPSVINPAYVGTHIQLSATSIYRNQWVNLEGAPKTFTTSLHSGFKKSRVGVGLLFGSDQIGVHSDNSLYGMYSYKIPLTTEKNGGVISFGLQAGFNSLKSDYFKTNPRDGAEIGAISKFNMNFGSGVFYRNKNLYAGLSVPYIVHNKALGTIYNPSDTVNSKIHTNGKQQRYYYLMGGFTKKLSPIVKWMPSVLFRMQQNSPLSFDINSMFIFYDAVSVGASYRLNDSFVGLFELQLNQNFHVGYAYDITTSVLRQYSNGTHEIMINYRIKISKIHRGLECPSYW
jgi:type IX secretion system PorP/SprF family membrane protein